MSAEDTLHDITIRVQQLEAYILKSPEYLRRADQELKRQVAMLYLAIALLLLFQGFFTFGVSAHIPLSAVILMGVTSFLAIVNCLLLIKTKTWLGKLNESWLGPQEKIALSSLRSQVDELQSQLGQGAPKTENASTK